MVALHCVPGVLSPDARVCSPWQVAIVPAMLGTLTCSYVIPFLREASAYEIAVDWRWRRVGGVSWMPAHDSIQFATMSARQRPPVLAPLRAPVWRLTSFFKPLNVSETPLPFFSGLLTNLLRARCCWHQS